MRFLILILLAFFGVSCHSEPIDPNKLIAAKNNSITPSTSTITIPEPAVKPLIKPQINSTSSLTFTIPLNSTLYPYSNVPGKSFEVKFNGNAGLSLLVDDEKFFTYEVNFTYKDNWTHFIGNGSYKAKCRVMNQSDNTEYDLDVVISQSNEITRLQIGSAIFTADRSLVSNTRPKVNTNPRKTAAYHIVKNGENLKLIAKKYKLSLEQLRNLNPTIENTIHPKDSIKIR